MTAAIARRVAPLILAASIMVALATVVKGYSSTGDGFAAGVIVALGTLVHFVALGREFSVHALPAVTRAPALSAIGLVVTLGVAFVPVALGEPPLTHWPPPGAEVAKLGSVELATAFLFDLGVFALVSGTVLSALGLVASLGRGARGSGTPRASRRAGA